MALTDPGAPEQPGPPSRPSAEPGSAQGAPAPVPVSDSRARLRAARPCLARGHLPRYDVRRVVDTRVDVMSDDEMLHPRGQDLGDEGERGQGERASRVPGSGGSGGTRAAW